MHGTVARINAARHADGDIAHLILRHLQHRFERTHVGDPRYFRTRLEAEAFIAGLLAEEAGAALVGFDFAFGYPADAGLPGGRALYDPRPGEPRIPGPGVSCRFYHSGDAP